VSQSQAQLPEFLPPFKSLPVLEEAVVETVVDVSPKMVDVQTETVATTNRAVGQIVQTTTTYPKATSKEVLPIQMAMFLNVMRSEATGHNSQEL
jgi:hypothetical protein